MAVIVPAVVSAAYGAFNMYQGSQKEKEAKRLAAANVRPTYQIPQGEKDNLSLAGYMAQQGLSAGSKQTYLDNANSGLSSSIDGILKGGGDPNDINKGYSTYLGNLSQVALLDDQAKLRNVQNLVGERRRMSDEQDKAFQVNEFAPYADRAQTYFDQGKQGYGQQNQGTGQLATGLASIGTGITADAQRARIANGGGTSGVGSSASDMTKPVYGISAPMNHGTDLVGPTNFDYATPPVGAAPAASSQNQFYNIGGQPTSYWQGLSPEDQQTLFNLQGTY